MKKLKAILAVVVLGLLALLPLSAAQRLGRWLGARIWRKKQGKVYGNTVRNIERCFPQLSAEEQLLMAERSLLQTGCSFAEMGMSWLWPVKRSISKIRSVNGESVLAEALEKGKGVILIAPHLGNWEMLNLYVSNRYTLTAMYKPPKMKLLDDLIKKMRARLGSQMAPADASGVRMVMKALKRGEIVGILPDQEPDDLKGTVFAPFFGVEAATMKLLPQLAKQTGAAVVCGFAERAENGAGFDIHFIAGEEAIGDKDLSVGAAAMNRSVEACVQMAPEQYQWEYRRFNTRPEGEERFY